jgi:hypothetical protein
VELLILKLISLLTDARFNGVAFGYRSPSQPFAAIDGRIAFYAAPFDCWVADERARPQPGQFYAGWITNELVGPFKGEPGVYDM